MECGEDISAAAVRETIEETSVRTSFQGILCFRQAHEVLFGKSDLFFVCALEPLKFDSNGSICTHEGGCSMCQIDHIKKQDSEIEKCEWIELNHFVSQSKFRNSELLNSMNEMLLDLSRNYNKVTQKIDAQYIPIVSKKVLFGYKNKYPDCFLFYAVDKNKNNCLNSDSCIVEDITNSQSQSSIRPPTIEVPLDVFEKMIHIDALENKMNKDNERLDAMIDMVNKI